MGNIKTENKQEALALLESCLESADYLNAGIQKVEGLYCVEVWKPTDIASTEQ